MSKASTIQKNELHKVNFDTFEINRNQLSTTHLEVEPKGITARQAVKRLMPKLIFLKQRGFSFNQILSVLTEHGLQLSQATFKTYYYDFKNEMRKESTKIRTKSSSSTFRIKAKRVCE
ncbi:MAG: hypothetical protein PXX73_06775 [Sideroxydans sp.]|nr:hypothetical protein [Sideroxydans sp.]